MTCDIIIPTCKSLDDVSPMICDMEGFSRGHNIIATCTSGSASQNRNIGLEKATSECVIMVDDDISGFYEGWIEDLLEPLADPNVLLSSAHLVSLDGSDAAMMYRGNRAELFTTVPRVPTAAIAFRKTKLRFDEGFKGSGYEDDWFCLQLQEANQKGHIVIANECKLVHANEMKNQTGKFQEHNSKHFEELLKKSGLQWLRERPAESYRVNVPSRTSIPKKIHFVWIGCELPKWADHNIKEFKRLNPGYEIKLHGEDSLDPRLKKHYESAKGHEKAYSIMSDLIRVSVLIKEGGWYFDTDMLPLVPLSEIPTTEKRTTLFSRADKSVVANGVIACNKNDAGIKHFFETILNSYKENAEWWSYGTVAARTAVTTKPYIYNILDILKITPITGKKDAIAAYNSKEKQETLRNSGAYMLHMEMQNSVDVECVEPYHSEHAQDEWLNTNIFKNKRNGVFVEVGVIDGLITSNSLFFERGLGWSGLLIEANPFMETAIRKNRPECKIEIVAVSDKNGKAIFLTCKNVTGWSGLEHSIESQHKDRIKQHHGEGQTESVEVTTAPLAGVLIKHNMSKIDYLSLDIEGAEYDALKSFPFDQFDIDVFDIENNYENDRVEKIMVKNGYKKIKRLGVNDIYRRKA